MSIRILIKKKVLLEKTSLPRLPSKGGVSFGNKSCFVISIKSHPLKGDLGGCQSEFYLSEELKSPLFEEGVWGRCYFLLKILFALSQSVGGFMCS